MRFGSFFQICPDKLFDLDLLRVGISGKSEQAEDLGAGVVVKIAINLISPDQRLFLSRHCYFIEFPSQYFDHNLALPVVNDRAFFIKEDRKRKSPLPILVDH